MSDLSFDTAVRDASKDFKLITVTIDSTVNADDTIYFTDRSVLGRPAKKILFLTTAGDDEVTFQINPYVKAKRPHRDRVDETVHLIDDHAESLTMVVPSDAGGGLVGRPEIVWDLCPVNNLAITDAVVGGTGTGGGLATVNILVA